VCPSCTEHRNNDDDDDDDEFSFIFCMGALPTVYAGPPATCALQLCQVAASLCPRPPWSWCSPPFLGNHVEVLHLSYTFHTLGLIVAEASEITYAI
jgi:hypothetical protein